jgi:peptide/nickel transport system permease protein
MVTQTVAELKVKNQASMNSLKRFWWRYKRNKAGVVGMIGVIIIVFIAIFAPLLSKYSPLQNNFEINLGLSFAHPFGTDDLGRDLFARTLFGTRVSLTVGILASLTSALIGIIVGAVAGYIGGLTDSVLMKVTEFFQMIPQFFLAIVIASFFGPSFIGIIIVIGALSWPSTARLVRAEFLSLKEQEFVLAAKSVGCRPAMIIFDEILPSAMPQVIVNTSLRTASAILIEASLNFFGLGDPTRISWGKMLYDAQSLIRVAPWASIFPGLAILVTVLSINLLGDGLNDALNPKFRER